MEWHATYSGQFTPDVRTQHDPAQYLPASRDRLFRAEWPVEACRHQCVDPMAPGRSLVDHIGRRLSQATHVVGGQSVRYPTDLFRFVRPAAGSVEYRTRAGRTAGQIPVLHIA